MQANLTRRARFTIADVARRAGVSVGTVSNVLSNPRAVRAQTRRRVEVAIAELNYRPNRIAQSLSRRHTNIVGMVVPDISNPFFSELMLGVEHVLNAADYAVVFGNAHDDAAKQRRYFDGFRERRVDGMVIAITPGTEIEDVASVGADLPVVMVDRTLSGWHGDEVVGDNAAGMEMAVAHLYQLGHRRLALVNGETRLSTAAQRSEGFERALRARGLSPVLLSVGSFTLESGFAQAAQLFSMAQRPTGICAGNDLLAMAVIAAANEYGLRVPEDLSVVGYDDITYARLVSPSLTTVRQSAYSMGTEAARLLMERISGRRSSDRVTVLRPEFVVRRSAGPAP